MKSPRARSLRVWSLLFLACATTLAACGSTSSPSSSAGSASPQRHAYIKQGFSLSFGSGWIARQHPAVQGGWDWTLELRDRAPGVASSSDPSVAVIVSPVKGTSLTPIRYQSYAAGQLNKRFLSYAPNDGTNGVIHHWFAATTINGIPAVWAACRTGSTAEGDEIEYYSLASGRTFYALEIEAEMTVWPREAPVLRSVVESFALLAGGGHGGSPAATAQ